MTIGDQIRIYTTNKNNNNNNTNNYNNSSSGDSSQTEYGDSNNVSYRLNLILKKIFFLSLVMEIPYGLVVLGGVYDGNRGSIIEIMNEFFIAIDNTTNIIFLSYMLEYNTDSFDKFIDRYNHFIAFFKCFGCLAFNNVKSMTNNAQTKKQDATRKTLNVNVHQNTRKKSYENNDESITPKKQDVQSVIDVQSVNHSDASKTEKYNFAVV